MSEETLADGSLVHGGDVLRSLAVWILLLSVPMGCSTDIDKRPNSRPVLRLATTTSTRDSGLLDELVPPFEQQTGARVDVIAVGTGKALKLGEAGDVDVVLVHAREAEDAFMRAGHGVRREDVMYNQFVLVGPANDPANVRGRSAVDALRRIARSQSTFLSRGDDSGTHKRERQLWREAGLRPDWGDYIESGQGMGVTLIMADQMNAYTLTDEGTYLRFRDKIELVPLVDSSEDLHNPYGVIAVNPAKNDRIQRKLANQFIDYLIADRTQQRIAGFRVAGEPLFHPSAVGQAASGQTNGQASGDGASGEPARGGP